MNPADGSFVEFATPTPNPADRDHAGRGRRAVVLRERRQPDRPHHHRRRDHRVPGAHARRRPGRHRCGPDGNCGSRRPHGPRRPHHAGRRGDGILQRPHAGLPAAVAGGAQRRHLVQRVRSGQIGRITMDGEVTEYPIPTPNCEPRAMVTHPDGHIWFVETKANALGRIDAQGRVTEWPVKTPNASLARRHRGARRRPLVHRELRQQDRPHGDRTARWSANMRSRSPAAAPAPSWRSPTGGCSSRPTTPAQSAR